MELWDISQPPDCLQHTTGLGVKDNVRHCDDALRYRHQNISLRMRKIPRVGQQAHKGISATVEFPFFGYRRAVGVLVSAEGASETKHSD
jgi:hypothetical protein